MKLQPKTRQLMIWFIGIICIVVCIGWAFGKVETKDALFVINTGMVGFLTLLKGEQ